MIAFDLARRLPFRLRPAALSAAVKRGVALELCYAPALRDEAARRNLIGNAAGAWVHHCPLALHGSSLGSGAGCGCMPRQLLSFSMCPGCQTGRLPRRQAHLFSAV